MKTKLIILGIFVIAVYGLVALIRWQPQTNTAPNNSEYVTVRDGKQYIELTAKGGYTPRSIQATAGMPTILQVATDNTYDCSSAISIPGQHVSESLPPTGTTEIDLGTPPVGTMQGTCAMGMYSFEIDFGK